MSSEVERHLNMCSRSFDRGMVESVELFQLLSHYTTYRFPVGSQASSHVHAAVGKPSKIQTDLNIFRFSSILYSVRTSYLHYNFVGAPDSLRKSFFHDLHIHEAS